MSIMATSSPQFLDAGAINSAQTWNHLKIQLTPFNRIISIPIKTFRNWTVEEKFNFIFLMKQTIHLDDVQYSMDAAFPDRVYLGSVFDFQQTSANLTTIPIGNALPYNAQVASSSSTPKLTAIPAGRAPTHYAHNPNMDLASINSINTNGLLKSDNNNTNKTKRPRSKAPKSGITRPPNCWMLFPKIIAKMWHALPQHHKQVWKDRAQQLKAEHKLLYPNYEYQPRRPSEIKRRAKTIAKQELGDIPSIPEEVAIPHNAAVPNNTTRLGNILEFDLNMGSEFPSNAQYHNDFGDRPHGDFSGLFGAGHIKQESPAEDLYGLADDLGLIDISTKGWA
ncbi:hypothetical protein SLS62_010984 [Diatrype stigma]|uniref:HMG box domain-containing protein n=1 Tax=Diatrype stigma TaxID=117547 RepID=A0AAN9U6A7_9PEZI